MCKYCNISSGNVSFLKTENLFDLRIKRHNNTYSLTAIDIESDDDIEIDINYCPMCGRQLGGK